MVCWRADLRVRRNGFLAAGGADPGLPAEALAQAGPAEAGYNARAVSHGKEVKRVAPTACVAEAVAKAGAAPSTREIVPIGLFDRPVVPCELLIARARRIW